LQEKRKDCRFKQNKVSPTDIGLTFIFQSLSFVARAIFFSILKKSSRIQTNKIMADTVYLTLDGYKRLKEELEYLKSVERNKVLDKVAEARSHGDLSENAEYEAAKEEQGQLESRIANLERTLSTASILDEKKIKTDKIYILTTAVLKNLADGKKVEYTLVSAHEADLEQGKISVQSPIGKSLLGKSVGEIVVVRTPGGEKRFEVLEIKVK
jgi:transcription elongation factor GreA